MKNRKSFRNIAVPFIVIILIAALGSIFIPVLGNSNMEFVTVTVKPGDSLWKIAQKYGPTDQNDIRKIIYDIKRINELDSSYIYNGQVLKVPQYR